MSALNLLGPAGAIDERQRSIAIWIAPLLAVLVVGACHMRQTRYVANLTQAVQTLRSDSAQLARQVAAVQRQVRVNADLAARRGLIDKLGRDRGRALRVLSGLSETLPAGIWLRDFEFADGIASISGSADDSLLLAKFLSRVEAVDAFSSFHVVDLKQDASTMTCGFVAKGRLGDFALDDLPIHGAQPTTLDSAT